MPLYEIAILEHPTKEDADKGAEEVLAWKGEVIAKNPETAKLKAMMDHGYMVSEGARNQNRFLVICRPFANG